MVLHKYIYFLQQLNDDFIIKYLLFLPIISFKLTLLINIFKTRPYIGFLLDEKEILLIYI